jgi:hypothetical protein
MVRAVAEETEYPVLLVRSDDNVIEGMHVYRGQALPAVDQVITVEVALSTVPIPGPPDSRLARVTRVVPGHKFPVRATQLDES